MPPQIKTLDIPLEGGLSQKTDALWLEPGSATAITNLVHAKHGSIQKRAGLVALTATTIRYTTTFGTTTTPLTMGRRLASYRGLLALMGRTAWSDTMFVYQDTFGFAEWVQADLLPEAYLYPYEVVGSPPVSVIEMDVAVAGGLEFIAWLQTTYADDTTGAIIYAMVRDAALGTILQPPIPIAAYQFAAAVGIPKLIVCGTKVVLVYSDRIQGNIWATAFDTSNPMAGWANGFGAQVNTTAGDSVNNISGTTVNPFDVCPVLGDTTKFGLIYERTNAGTRTIQMNIVTVSTMVIASSATVNGSDSTWTTDNGVSAANGQLTALALRIDTSLSRASFTYGWRSATTTHATFGSFTYPGLAAVASSIDLYGTPGPTAPSTDKAPSIMGVEYSTALATHVVRLSPANAVLGQGATQLPYIASWQVAVGSSTIALLGTAQPRVTWGASLWSRDLPLNGISYCVGYCPSNTQGTFYLFADDAWQDVTTTSYGDRFPLRLVGTIAPRLSSAMVPSVAAPMQSRVASHLPLNPYAPGVATYEAMVPVELNVFTLAPALLRFDMQSPLYGQSCELGQNLCIAAGCPSAFDGTNCFELGYPYYPVITGISMAGSGGSLSAGNYLYIAVYWIEDARGQVHMSARSAPLLVTAVNNDKATVTIAAMGFSAKTKKIGGAFANSPQFMQKFGPNVQVKLYRTQVGGTSYTNVLANDAAAAINTLGGATVSAVDGASDASILANTLLYSDGSDGTSPGNFLDNNCPPAFQAMIVHNNRLFGVDGPRIWPSKEFTTGEGSAFHEVMAFSVDDGPGPVTALASMDDKLVLFKGDRLLFMTGLGPADNGQDNDFTQPQRIASDVGCIDWRGVVSTPQGVFFRSPAGRRLLTRDLQVIPVPDVEDVELANPAATSALIHPTSGRVLFTMNADDVASPRVGTILQEDYVIGAWTQSVMNDNAGHPTVGFVSATVAQAITAAGPPTTTAPTYHVLRADGVVMRETASKDVVTSGAAGFFVPSTWTSPWIKADGLQGWGYWAEVRVAFQVLDPCALTITIASDYGQGTPEVHRFTAAQLATMGPLGIIPLQVVNQRAGAIQVTITDASDTTTVTGQGVRLQGVRVDYGYEPGGYRAPIAQQA